MKRRTFLGSSALALTGTFAGTRGMNVALANQTQSRSEGGVSFASQPVLTNVTQSSVHISVAPDTLATGWVEYGTTEALGEKAEGIVQGMRPLSERILHFPLRDLKPGRTYYYRVHLQAVVFVTPFNRQRRDTVVSPTYRFRTLDANADTATFACWNDTHENDETLARLTDMLQEQQPDFLIWNGDVTNDIHREEQIVGQFFNPGGQAYATSTPMMFGRGNHDVRGRSSRRLREYLNGPEGLYYYAFRQGPLACVMMDTGEDKPDQTPVYAGLLDFESYRAEQAQWLAEVIEQPWFTSAPHRVVFMHIPLVWDAEVPERWPRIWGEGIRGWICEDGYEKWHDLLVRGKVQLVISGHTHRHAYFPPNASRPYGQLIGGGPQPERTVCITGQANATSLQVKAVNLDHDVLEELAFEPVIQ